MAQALVLSRVARHTLAATSDVTPSRLTGTDDVTVVTDVTIVAVTHPTI